MDYLQLVKTLTSVYVLVSAILIERWASPRSLVWIGVYGLLAILAPMLVISLFVMLIGALLKTWSVLSCPERCCADANKYYVLHDKELARRYRHRTIPMQLAIELYMNEKLDFKHDLYTILREHRHEIFTFSFTWAHFWFLISKLVPQAFSHTKTMDGGEVMPVYNRGNDFYNYFLGDTMVYTSGIYTDGNDTLEDAQRRKMRMLCQKLQLKEGDELLDIGCGWGTLSRFAAKEFRANVLGITICQEQVDWANKGIEEDGTAEHCQVKLMDYRDVPNKKFDKIVCVEMAEHVGILRFQSFMRLVKDRLKDDGIFVLQIAGLRRAWRFEDLVWGCFMGTYIFPAADASTPLAWFTGQVETAGFEVWSTQNIGIHYSRTLKQWYDNWLTNRDAVVHKYGEWWFRLWCMFLSWSSIIASQGSSTCWQITMHKNIDQLDRKRYINEKCYGIVEE